MDRISELPEGLIQYILSFLPAEEAVQTAILSKSWLHKWCTIPDLDFSQKRICQKHFKTEDWYNHSRDEQLRDKFIKFVDNTLQRHNLCINKCKFFLYIEDKELASSFDKWLEIVVAKDVKQLSLLLSLPYPFYKYTLPQTIFTANSMISLEVHGDRMIGFKLCDHQLVKKCYTLKKLYLDDVKVSKSTIRSLSSIFPCIEELTLSDCSPREIKLSNLPNLKIFYVRSIYSPTVDITEAHSLQSFTYFSYVHKHDLEQHFNILPCQSLKSLSITESSIRSISLSNLLSQCTSLEELELTTCNSLEWINISSTSLKSFTLKNGSRLEEIKIDAPNLSVLNYTNSVYPSFSLTNRSKDLEPSLDLSYGWELDDLNTSFFIKLRGILAQIKPSKMSLTVSIYDKISLDIDELRKVSALDPNPKLENLGMELCLYTSRLEISTCSKFLDGLFWSTCLKSLTVRLTEDEQLPSLESLCKELMERKRSPECCDTNQTMCWRHQLNHVDVEYMEDEDEDEEIKRWHHLDWKSWIDGSYTFVDTCEGEVYIRFTLNWQ